MTGRLGRRLADRRTLSDKRARRNDRPHDLDLRLIAPMRQVRVLRPLSDL